MKDWYASHAHLFVQRSYDHPGCDTYIGCAHLIKLGSVMPLAGVQ